MPSKKNNRNIRDKRNGNDLKDIPQKSEEHGKSTADYYGLKTEAVDKLVNASKDTAPKVSDEEIAKVSGRKKFRIPNIVKVMFIKFWFHGAICFFFFLGLGTYVTNIFDMIFVLMIATGVITDLLTNRLIRFIEPEDRDNDRYLMVRTRKYWSFPLNILYAVPLVYCIVSIYGAINIIITGIGGEGAKALSVGPILYGIFGLIIDQLFVGARNLFAKILADAQVSAGKHR
ncbi:MAG: hypothetical protein K6E85_08865 [Lachnospiraceae bacterium]|nr:hypothetical protein [Lachnospiraceae bacterium]